MMLNLVVTLYITPLDVTDEIIEGFFAFFFELQALFTYVCDSTHKTL
jgi:hypothetical protein